MRGPSRPWERGFVGRVSARPPRTVQRPRPASPAGNAGRAQTPNFPIPLFPEPDGRPANGSAIWINTRATRAAQAVFAKVPADPSRLPCVEGIRAESTLNSFTSLARRRPASKTVGVAPTRAGRSSPGRTDARPPSRRPHGTPPPSRPTLPRRRLRPLHRDPAGPVDRALTSRAVRRAAPRPERPPIELSSSGNPPSDTEKVGRQRFARIATRKRRIA